MEDIVRYVVLVTEICGISIIFRGFMKAMVRAIIEEAAILRNRKLITNLNIVRRELGVYLLLGLEVIIVSDIVQTITTPTQQHLLWLGSIVVIRIAISYFLGKEVENLKQ